MADTFKTHFLKLLGTDCQTISGHLKVEMEIIGQQGWGDTRQMLVKFQANAYGPVKIDQAGLKVETFLTQKGRIFSYVSGQSKNLRDVARLVYHRQLSPEELAAYLESIPAKKLEPVLELELEM